MLLWTINEEMGPSGAEEECYTPLKYAM